MFLATPFATVLCLLHLPFVIAQFPPKPEGVTVLDSKFNDGIYISYKEVWSYRVNTEHMVLILDT